MPRENTETRQDDVIDPILVAGPTPRPPASGSDDGPVNRFQKARLIEQGRNLTRQERNEIIGSIPDFVNDLGSAVNERDDVLEIVTAEMVAAPTPVPGLQLRRNQVGRRDRAYLLARWQRESLCMVERRPLPSVLKAEDRRVTWHQVDQ